MTSVSELDSCRSLRRARSPRPPRRFPRTRESSFRSPGLAQIGAADDAAALHLEIFFEDLRPRSAELSRSECRRVLRLILPPALRTLPRPSPCIARWLRGTLPAPRGPSAWWCGWRRWSVRTSVTAVSEPTSLTFSSGTPISSAAICVSTVWLPWPISVLPLSTDTEPSA